MGPLGYGALPLLIYPWCLLANGMSMAAPRDSDADPVHLVMWMGFLWGTTLYPVVYGIAAGLSYLMGTNDRPVAAARIAQVPLIYLGCMLLMMLLAFATER